MENLIQNSLDSIVCNLTVCNRPVGRVFVLGGRAIRAEGATFTAGGLGGAESPPTGPGQSPGGGPGGNPRKLCNFTVLRVID